MHSDSDRSRYSSQNRGSESQIVKQSDNPYLKLRRKASRAQKALREKEQEFLKKKRVMMKKMDRQFQTEVQELADVYDDITDEISEHKRKGQRHAQRKIKQIKRKAVAEDLDYDEEDKLIRQVEEAYYREYCPDDEYTNQNQEMLLNSFAPNLLQLLTGMGKQPIMISNMSGDRGGDRSRTSGNSRRRTHRSNRNEYMGRGARITELEN